LREHKKGATKLVSACKKLSYEQRLQGDHSPDTLKFPDISLTMCGTHAHVKWYS